MMKTLKLLFVVSLLLSSYQVIGQDWVVPESANALENPLEYNLENIEAGKVLYMKNCKSCHGDPGKNNALPLVPAPVDIASEAMHQNTDGAMFYKISKGRGTMLQFELTLSETEIWSLVTFINNYKPGGEQLLVDLPPVKANLLASLSNNEAMVNVIAEYVESESGSKAIPEVPVNISLKRAFGNLKIGEAFTNQNGRAEFVLPENIIRDEEGLLTFVISMNENFDAKEVVLKSAIKGDPKDMPQIIEDGVLYSTNDRIPAWLLLSYIGAVGGIWLVIAYIIFQIIKVKRLSNS